MDVRHQDPLFLESARSTLIRAGGIRHKRDFNVALHRQGLSSHIVSAIHVKPGWRVGGSASLAEVFLFVQLQPR